MDARTKEVRDIAFEILEKLPDEFLKEVCAKLQNSMEQAYILQFVINVLAIKLSMYQPISNETKNNTQQG